MKNKNYFLYGILGLCAFVFILAILFYYGQSVSTEYEFTTLIEFKNIYGESGLKYPVSNLPEGMSTFEEGEIITGPNGEQYTVKDSTSSAQKIRNSYINFKIGTLKLETNGSFSKTYYIPKIIGCIKTLTPENVTILEDNQLNVYFVSPQYQEWKTSKIYQTSNKIEFKGSKQLDMIANSAPALNYYDWYQKNKVISVVFYELLQKEDNPFDFDYDNRYRFINCDNIENIDATLLIEIPTN